MRVIEISEQHKQSFVQRLYLHFLDCAFFVTINVQLLEAFSMLFSKRSVIPFITLSVSTFMLSSFVLAEPSSHVISYVSGHEALEVWDAQAMNTTPQWVKIWLMIMAVSFATGLLFVWKHPIARWVVGGFIASLIASKMITSVFDVVGLSGFVALMHLIFWSPALYQLLSNKPFLKERSAFSIWSGVITFVILFSFIFDIRDAVIYLNHIL